MSERGDGDNEELKDITEGVTPIDSSDESNDEFNDVYVDQN